MRKTRPGGPVTLARAACALAPALLAALLLPGTAGADTVVTTHQTGTNNGYSHSFWTDSQGKVSMNMGSGRQYGTSCSGGYVGLTFDDGPSATTRQLLDALRQNGLRATMFNQGQNAAADPATVKAQADAGMWVANHSYTHPHMTTMTQAQMESEISRTQQAITAAGVPAPTLFRPPYGETNATLKAAEAAAGLREIIWDVDSQDWNNASTDAIVQAVGRLTAGQVILMHDWPANTLAAIPRIAQTLANKNLCTGMISPTTGRAVAPDGSGGGGGGGGGGTGSCTATLSAGQSWSDRYNLGVVVSGSTDWTVTVTVPTPAKVLSTWNITASYPNAQTLVAKPNGSGDNWGMTIQHNGNWTWPGVTCTAA